MTYAGPPESRDGARRPSAAKSTPPRSMDGSWSAAAILEQRLDVAFQFTGLVLGRKAPYHRAVTIDQELGEVPFDGLGAQHARRGGLQVLVQRMGVGAVDLHLGEHGEGHIVGAGAERADLCLVARLLRAELV